MSDTNPLSCLFFGTWQFGGQFKTLDLQTITYLIEFALRQGINKFDTAMVYGQGQVETLLGDILPKDAFITTKIPAKVKPEGQGVTVHQCYDREWIELQLDSSLRRLRRSKVDILLLHNWSRYWTEPEDILYILQSFKQTGLADKIGISLPDGFHAVIDEQTCKLVDVIQAPYNTPSNLWVTDSFPMLKTQNVQIMLRSIFLQGILLMDQEHIQRLASQDIRRAKAIQLSGKQPGEAEDLLACALQLETSVVVGMTTAEQITRNINTILKLRRRRT